VAQQEDGILSLVTQVNKIVPEIPVTLTIEALERGHCHYLRDRGDNKTGLVTHIPINAGFPEVPNAEKPPVRF